jgi:hypothetical protein
MDTVKVAQTANIMYKTIPPTHPSQIKPLFNTILHNTSDNSANILLVVLFI